MGILFNPLSNDLLLRNSSAGLSGAPRRVSLAGIGLDAALGMLGDPAAFAELFKGLPAALPRRPPVQAASLQQAAAALYQLLARLAQFVEQSGMGRDAYYPLASMNALLGQTMSNRALFQQGLGSKFRIGSDFSGSNPGRPTIGSDGKPEQPKRIEEDEFGNVQVGSRTESSTTQQFVELPTCGMGMGMGQMQDVTTSVTIPIYAKEQGVASNLANSPEAVLALSKILEGDKKLSPEEVQKQLFNEYGIAAKVETVNGRKAIKFANGDFLTDSSGDGALNGIDYNFKGAVDKIKGKYGLSDDDVKAFDKMGGYSLEGLKRSREMMEEWKKMFQPSEKSKLNPTPAAWGDAVNDFDPSVYEMLFLQAIRFADDDEDNEAARIADLIFRAA